MEFTTACFHNNSQCPTSNTPPTQAKANTSANTTVTAKPSALATASNAPAKVLSHPPALTTSSRLTNHPAGGWDPQTSAIPSDTKAQIEQAFSNVDLTLRSAGGAGWSQVFRVNSYHLPLNDEALGVMVECYRKWMPDHQPIWTAIGVPQLGEKEMVVEIEVVAHVPEEKKKAVIDQAVGLCSSPALVPAVM